MKNKTSQNILAQTNTQINRGVNDVLFQFNVLLQKIKKNTKFQKYYLKGKHFGVDHLCTYIHIFCELIFLNYFPFFLLFFFLYTIKSVKKSLLANIRIYD